MIGIIDYGLGNVQAFLNIYKKLGFPAMTVQTIDQVDRATKFILPGVGSFDWAMERLHASGMKDRLEERVLGAKQPVLGVCVGMQMLARSSEEGHLPGLGWVPGIVKKFDEDLFSQKTHLPHMGWNDVTPYDHATLFNGMKEQRYYFLHSYHFIPDDKAHVLATTSYGYRFASSVCVGNIYGTQFHPEKSHQWGIRLLKNFAEF